MSSLVMSALFDIKCVTIFDRINVRNEKMKKCKMPYKAGTQYVPEAFQRTDGEG